MQQNKNCFSSGKPFRNSRTCQNFHVKVFPRPPHTLVWCHSGGKKKILPSPIVNKKKWRHDEYKNASEGIVEHFHLFFFQNDSPLIIYRAMKSLKWCAQACFLSHFWALNSSWVIKPRKNSWLSAPRLFMSQHTTVLQWENKSNKSWQWNAMCKQVTGGVVALTRLLQALQSGTCVA